MVDSDPVPPPAASHPQKEWERERGRVALSQSNEIDLFTDIGMEIVAKCDGLPLAIKVVGGVLRGRRTNEWKNINDHGVWSLAWEEINKAVYLSYEDLSSELKQCFLLYSLIPKDRLISRGTITNMWIAEGYTQQGPMPSEYSADEYCNELISRRNLLETDKRVYEQGACIMHDVACYFAQYITEGEALHLSDWKGEDNNSRKPGNSKLRHLSMSNKATVEWGALIRQRQPSLRTLTIYGSINVDFNELKDNLSSLRVLNLSDVDVAEIPEYVCHLRHLRYLGISGTSIDRIPRDRGDLKFLQCLDLTGSNISQLPDSILNLQNLRFLNIEGTSITSVPRGIGRLVNLDSILGFPTHFDETPDGWCSLDKLASLSELKRLHINNIQDAFSGSMASGVNLSCKEHLLIVKFQFTPKGFKEMQLMDQVLSNLCPPPSIEELDIIGYYGVTLPWWMRMMESFQNLRRLDINYHPNCKHLPFGLGQLPFLDYFWVRQALSVTSIGHDLFGPSPGGDGNEVSSTSSASTSAVAKMNSRWPQIPFPKLRKLAFQDMLLWSKWEWDQKFPAMPAMEFLTISDWELEHLLPRGLVVHATALRYLDLRNWISLPLTELKVIGNGRLQVIANIPKLRHLHIHGCPRLISLHALPSLESIEWRHLQAEQLSNYMRSANTLYRLVTHCHAKLLKLISLKEAGIEWEKISHVQHIEAYGYSAKEDKRYIFYTWEPYSFHTDMEPDFSEAPDSVRRAPFLLDNPSAIPYFYQTTI
uniref:Uncharacterized protein n=1 Tax=Leersia perrieri TaxID=77586 RepID=A0A0D9WYS7_9ORYZ